MAFKRSSGAYPSLIDYETREGRAHTVWRLRAETMKYETELQNEP